MVEAESRQKSLAKLLRCLGKAGCRVEEDGLSFRLHGADGSLGTVPAAVAAFGISRGLVLRRGEWLFATQEAGSWLRRLISAREEAYLDQHRTAETVELASGTERRTVTINGTASPLAALARLKDRNGDPWLPTEAVDAGERLAQDFQYAALQPRVTQSYEPQSRERKRRGCSAAADLKDSVIAARDRVRRAVEAMGPDLSGVALDICCFEKGLETVERERQWPARSAKLMLKTALLQLHRHYNPPVASAGRRRHAWGGEGFRPEIAR